jgi:hypothetical protein
MNDVASIACPSSALRVISELPANPHSAAIVQIAIRQRDARAGDVSASAPALETREGSERMVMPGPSLLD